MSLTLVMLMLGVSLGLSVQAPVVTTTDPLNWETDVLILQWRNTDTGKPADPPKNIAMYNVRCGPVSQKYTHPYRPMFADQLVIGVRALVDEPKTPTRWFCIVETTREDGSRGPVSAEFSFIVQ